MWLFALFLAVPLIEVALFIEIGGLIGLWPTLGLVVLTAAAGALVVRAQGARALDDLGRALATLADPARPLAHGAMILSAGVLLLTPGFFTDALGLLLLLPPVRETAFARLRARMAAGRRRPGAAGGGAAGVILEGEAEEVGGPVPRPTHAAPSRLRH
jgi:UPF0716 protein FxsA